MLMVRTAAALVACGLVAALSGDARGQDEPGGVRRPERLTAGVGDQYLGQLAPDGRTLLFLSNRNTANEIFRQDVDEGRVKLLFDEGADVSWPRVSPDGRALLYISFRDQAQGQLCVRDLPAAEGRRCLVDGATALQAEWLDARRILLVSRPSIPGDLAVMQVTVGAGLTVRPLLQRNLIGPAVSPDGRWLVYVPVERQVQRVGPAFAARAAPRLEAVRLDRLDSPPAPLQLDLPGITGQPAFSRDGRHLYVVQFMSDSNHDGVIDADDHGLLFRVPFELGRDDAPARASAAVPEQLTQATLNCQYPSPAADRLVFTCARKEALDVYALPLEGAVPGEWTAEMLATEVELAARRADALLLVRHQLARAHGAADRAAALLHLARLHLEQDEFAAAAFYAHRVASLSDPLLAQLSEPLAIVIEHRQAIRDRERGRTVEAVSAAARKRLERLAPRPNDGPPATALRHVFRSEIQDWLGDKAAARCELEAAARPGLPPAVLAAYHERADALYRELDDRDTLVEVGRRLSADPALSPEDRLDYARSAVRALLRGLPHEEAEAALARARPGLAEGSELAFAVDLAWALLAVRDPRPTPQVREALMALYHRQTRPDRRRSIILDAARRVAEVGADEVMESLSEAYVRDGKPGSTERRRAERLFQRAIGGRAFRQQKARRLAEARADFDAIADVTGSLDAVVSSLELRMRMGEKPADLAAERARRMAAGGATATDRFVRAYLLARTLPQLGEEEHAKAVADALAALRASWKELKQSYAAHALFGAVLHEQYLHTRVLASAERANVHFLVALELVRNEPRWRAMILGQLGLLHTAVGNHRIALKYLAEREKLPFADNAAGVAIQLARARALLHVGQEVEAAKVADAALARVDAEPRLAPYRVLALDRAALYHLAAGEFPRALALYDAELPLADAGQGSTAARNRVTLRLARAAAALGADQPVRALADLDVVDAGLADPASAARLQWPRADPDQVLRTYRLIAAGLRADASQRLGDAAAAARALGARRELLVQQLGKTGSDRDLRALTLSEARLAESAGQRGERAEAARWLGRALDHADALVSRTHAPLHPDQLAVLRLAGELGARERVAMPFDLPKRLRDASARIGERKDAAWRHYQRWFEIYVTLLEHPEAEQAGKDAQAKE